MSDEDEILRDDGGMASVSTHVSMHTKLDRILEAVRALKPGPVEDDGSSAWIPRAQYQPVLAEVEHWREEAVRLAKAECAASKEVERLRAENTDLRMVNEALTAELDGLSAALACTVSE